MLSVADLTIGLGMLATSALFGAAVAVLGSLPGMADADSGERGFGSAVEAA